MVRPQACFPVGCIGLEVAFSNSVYQIGIRLARFFATRFAANVREVLHWRLRERRRHLWNGSCTRTSRRAASTASRHAERRVVLAFSGDVASDSCRSERMAFRDRL